MPWTTAAVVFGAWAVILLLTVTYFLVWSRKHDWDEEGDER